MFKTELQAEPFQVYLIEYNQQLKDACIKSDKMTSTHKVHLTSFHHSGP